MHHKIHVFEKHGLVILTILSFLLTLYMFTHSHFLPKSICNQFSPWRKEWSNGYYKKKTIFEEILSCELRNFFSALLQVTSISFTIGPSMVRPKCSTVTSIFSTPKISEYKKAIRIKVICASAYKIEVARCIYPRLQIESPGAQVNERMALLLSFSSPSSLFEAKNSINELSARRIFFGVGRGVSSGNAKTRLC